MASTPSTPNDGSDAPGVREDGPAQIDKWSEQASLYSDVSSRITELHAADLVTLLKDDILTARVILDVGGGTGAFAKAYAQQFPRGVPGQTLIVSDLSPGMVEKARETVRLPPDFQTRVVFQEEDGEKLGGIDDDSVDVVVSLFAIFLIPDQEAAARAVRRVLKKPGGTFANGSWVFDQSASLVSLGFGVSVQDAFLLPNELVDPSKADRTGVPYFEWATRELARRKLTDDYRLDGVTVSCALHTFGCSFDPLWAMMLKNPMSVIATASEADQQRAKDALRVFLESDGVSSVDRPLLLSTASILAIGRGVQ